jgi:hypothetical protein
MRDSRLTDKLISVKEEKILATHPGFFGKAGVFSTEYGQ